MHEYKRQCNLCERMSEFYSDIKPIEIYSSKEWHESQFCILHRERLNPEDAKKSVCDSLNSENK